MCLPFRFLFVFLQCILYNFNVNCVLKPCVLCSTERILYRDLATGRTNYE